MLSNKTLAAGLLMAAPTASAAQSLINGQEVRYNFAYRCKGERVIIAHCRDEQDSSYCQTVYPDRPWVNGMQVAPVEMRGDVVAKLNACNRAASAPAPAARRARAPARTAPSKPTAKVPASYAKIGKPPGVGRANWYLMDFDKESATFFTWDRIKRSGNKAEGWFTIVYPKPIDIPEIEVKGVQYFQMHYVANCAKGTDSVSEAAYLDGDGKILSGATLTEAQSPFEKVEAGTLAAEQLDIMCGKSKGAVNKEPIVSDGLGLLFVYVGLLKNDVK